MINELIRETMMDKRLTINDVANATGYSHSLICDIVLKDVAPRTEEAYRIMNSMGVDLGDILR